MIFLDEVYATALCASSNNGECLEWEGVSLQAVNEILEYLSRFQGKVMIIVAGYADRTLNSFFKINQGIPRRFTSTFYLEPYRSEDLMSILFLQLTERGISREVFSELALLVLQRIFDTYGGDPCASTSLKNYFPDSAGDMSILADHFARWCGVRNISAVSGLVGCFSVLFGCAEIFAPEIKVIFRFQRRNNSY